MRTIFVVEYPLPGPRNQVLHQFTSQSAADEYVTEFPPEYQSAHLRVVPVKVYDSPEEAMREARRGT